MTLTKNKILLLYPPSRHVVRLGFSLPVLYSYLKGQGFEVKVLDCPGLEYSIEDVLAEIEEFDPAIIGVSIPATIMCPDGQLVLEAIRERFPNKLLVAGGIHAWLMPEDLIDRCDLVCLGLGQETLKEIGDLYPGPEVFAVDGIAYKKNGQVVYTNSRKTDASRLPGPDWSCVPFEKYTNLALFWDPETRAVPAFTTLGCYNHCSFCAGHKLYRRRMQFRDIELVLDEVEAYIQKHRLRYFTFYDPLFTASPKRTMELCRRMIERGIEIKWTCTSTVNLISDELVRAMAEAGCIAIAFGLESANEFILKQIGKDQINAAMMKSALEVCKKHDVKVISQIILGFPDDTIETVWENISVTSTFHIDSYGVSLLTPYPGTDEAVKAKAKGRIIVSDYEELSPFQVSYIAPALEGYDLPKCYRFAFYYFYSRDSQRLDAWLKRFTGRPEYPEIEKGWRELYENRATINFEYFVDYVTLDPARRKVKERRFFEPFLPDFSRVHKKETLAPGGGQD